MITIEPGQESNPNGHNPVGPDKDKKIPPPDDSILAARWLTMNPLTGWGMGEFRRYQSGVWVAVDTDDIRKEIKATVEAARPEGVRATNARLESTLELARVDISRRSDAWDSNHDYLVCKNGALHIPTRTLQPHNPELYATSGLDFDYSPTAKAPVFESVLTQCIPGAAEFVQEFAGYALTVDTSHEIALWLYGPPGSGKSTVLAGLQAMLGERAGLLGLADIERSRFSLNNLPGKTLVISTEQPDSYMAATHILNAIISGEPLTIEQKFRDAVKITPRAKVAWAMNDLPRVNGANNGVMRRVKVVKFPAITEADRNPTVKERVKTEGAGILNWALVGLARLRERGRFVVPECVIDATNEFRDSNDIPALFLEEAGCLRGDQYETTGGQLYDRYKTWCMDTGHKAQSSTSLANDWRRLGLEKRRMNGKTFWRGVGFPVEQVGD
jgi:putative DNA primase/helicase